MWFVGWIWPAGLGRLVFSLDGHLVGAAAKHLGKNHDAGAPAAPQAEAWHHDLFLKPEVLSFFSPGPRPTRTSTTWIQCGVGCVCGPSLIHRAGPAPSISPMN